jgi:FkbM family methyltransferase
MEQGLFELADYQRKMPRLYKVNGFWCREGSADDNLLTSRIADDNWKYVTDVHADETWLDIGAHIGTFGAVIAPRVARVLAFEACPETFEVLKLNTATLPNVECLHQAVIGTGQRSVRFHQAKGRTMGRVVEHSRSYVEVPAVEFASLLHAPVCVKMDIEGGEKDILEHTTDWSNIKRFLLEFHSKALKDDDHAYCKKILERFRQNFVRVETDFKEEHHNWAWYIYGQN